jgi:serine/threonine protein kinase
MDESQFSFIKVIGKGTYGKIILVRSKYNGMLYALKSIDKSYLTRTHTVHLIISEKYVLTEISHPFIIKLYSKSKNDNKLFMLFDYYNGGDLFFHLHRKVKIYSENEAKFIAAQLLLVLEYLHSKRILYRDLKPENIIFDHEGYIRLIDFGFAQKIKENEMKKTACGTDEYLCK